MLPSKPFLGSLFLVSLASGCSSQPAADAALPACPDGEIRLEGTCRQDPRGALDESCWAEDQCAPANARCALRADGERVCLPVCDEACSECTETLSLDGERVSLCVGRCEEGTFTMLVLGDEHHACMGGSWVACGVSGNPCGCGCIDGEVCSQRIESSGTCEVPRAAGSACDYDGVCANGRCVDGRCVANKADGERCTTHVECASRACSATSGVCQPASGADCVAGSSLCDECYRGTCAHHCESATDCTRGTCQNADGVARAICHTSACEAGIGQPAPWHCPPWEECKENPIHGTHYCE